jgi:hypothetical protein
VREARGTAGLAAACRAYRDALGAPVDPGLVACFLDAGEPELLLCGLDGLRRLAETSPASLSSGLRTQLRMLAQSSDDDVASAAEALLARR